MKEPFRKKSSREIIEIRGRGRRELQLGPIRSTAAGNLTASIGNHHRKAEGHLTLESTLGPKRKSQLDLWVGQGTRLEDALDTMELVLKKRKNY